METEGEKIDQNWKRRERLPNPKVERERSLQEVRWEKKEEGGCLRTSLPLVQTCGPQGEKKWRCEGTKGRKEERRGRKRRKRRRREEEEERKVREEEGREERDRDLRSERKSERQVSSEQRTRHTERNDGSLTFRGYKKIRNDFSGQQKILPP